MSNSTSRSAKGAATPSKRVTDTTPEELESMMLNAKVTGLFLEALGNQSNLVADPEKEQLGKKKNHWVLRLEIAEVSVERDPGSMKCSKMTLKPLSYKGSLSTSAQAHFKFELLQINLHVCNFVDAARPLLPFYYIIVAKELKSTSRGAQGGRGGRGGRSGRDQQLLEHPNGCRDFTADRIDMNPITKANFPSSYSRVLGPFEVTLDDNPDGIDGVTIVDADKRTYNASRSKCPPLHLKV
ncbi:hypothetical protein VM1G_11722 [Cytospora mali]|uniref:Uncharacterized protein n=1 Tax=Cytospora mali TaxID=578113 RepID=A0A194W336_CYTMA|nr:hypothetical protein VM1G_11722 [Valsa mali]